MSRDGGNPFEVLGVELRFDLDEAVLRRRLIQLSAQLHPDRFSDPVEQAEAAERIAVVNEAYRVLCDPESRADALLAALGGPGKSDDKSLPPELLGQMLELREELEEAVAAGDAVAIEKMRTLAHQERTARLGRIAELFRSDGPDGAAIRKELNALRYFERMIEQLP